ncbi:MAG: DUF3737 family protein [Clostridia bacterium]|nr:DUF3737 family protein [Clostridia bacterium]
MNIIQNMTFDEERALYASRGVCAVNCRFDGPRDGESAFKESRDIEARECFFNLRYPFWHDERVKIYGCEMTPACRAALWYTSDADIKSSILHGTKALRECSNVTVEKCDIVSAEFGWYCNDITVKDCNAEGEYFMMRSDNLNFSNVTFKGKYSFQYISNSVFENCNFDTKDAFWHAKDVVVKNSVIKGEYLGWYCENVTFENCEISGTQPLCYCRGLKLINCRMSGADLSFERSEADVDVKTPVISIKNPKSGIIRVAGVDEIIRDIDGFTCKIEVNGEEK